jgi:hypothetical protein
MRKNDVYTVKDHQEIFLVAISGLSILGCIMINVLTITNNSGSALMVQMMLNIIPIMSGYLAGYYLFMVRFATVTRKTNSEIKKTRIFFIKVALMITIIITAIILVPFFELELWSTVLLTVLPTIATHNIIFLRVSTSKKYRNKWHNYFN